MPELKVSTGLADPFFSHLAVIMWVGGLGKDVSVFDFALPVQKPISGVVFVILCCCFAHFCF